jgi:hypothetical protein
VLAFSLLAAKIRNAQTEKVYGLAEWMRIAESCRDLYSGTFKKSNEKNAMIEL